MNDASPAIRFSRKPKVFLGDVVRALETLAPTNTAVREQIVGMLGFEQGEEHAPGTVESSLPPSYLPSEPVPQPVQLPEPVPEPVEPTSQNWIPSTLEALGTTTQEQNLKVPPLPLSAGDTEVVPLPFSPLFAPQWTRAILSATLATNGGDGSLDVEQLVEQLARREPIDHLPRMPAPTLRRGVQLLVDSSEGMAPFARDQAYLQDEIMNVVGADHVTALRFVGCPSRGVGSGPRRRWPAYYDPPPPGTVVLLLTDLGIGRPPLATDYATTTEWEAFAVQVKRARCPVVALVPYAPARYPLALSYMMTIIQWDRHTAVGDVYRQVGPAHEVW